MNTKTRVLIGLPLVAAAAVCGSLGIAHAGTLPSHGSTIAMTLNNDTDQPMNLAIQYTNVGHFIDAPQQTLAPHSSEVVTASNINHDPMAVVFNYTVPNTDTLMTFEANNLPDGANTSGTIITGSDSGSYTVTRSTDTGFPNMNASYTVHRTTR